MPAIDPFQSNRIICEGGLDSTDNHINLSVNKPGAATALVNYEPGLDGGYRRILGYTAYDTTYQEVGVGVAEGRVLGIILFDNSSTDLTMVIAARKNIADANYTLYQYESGTGWVAIAPGFTLTATNVVKLRYAVGNDGDKNVLVIVDGVNYATMYDGTTWSQIKVANTGADFANAGGNQALDAPALVSFFQQTLFLGGELAHKGVVAHSSPNAFHDFLAANGAGQVTIGFPVVQYKPFRDSLYVFGKNAIKKIIADVSSGFLLDEVTTNIGCVARDSVIEIGGDLIFLAPDGFRPVAGTSKIGDVQLETLSKSIHDLVKARIVSGIGDHVDAVVIRGKSQFRIFFSSSIRDAVSTKGILGGLRTADQMNGWEFSEIQGFRASCVTSQYVNGVEIILHGDFDGKVYQQEVGDTLNGTDMLAVYATPFLDFGDTEIRKTFEKITLFLKGQDDFYFQAQVEYDWNNTDVTNPNVYTIDVSNQSVVYGDGSDYGGTSVVYGGVTQPRALTNVEGSFFSTKITFTTYGDIPSYAIHGIIFEYKLEGRR